MGDSRPTVQRTLVKSPPELWADLSNPESLAKRLGEFGEIRITRLVPEKTVAWEGERASGTVEIEPSGWGTKVRLSAQPTAPAIEEDMITEDDLERGSALEAAQQAEIEREAAIEAALLEEIQREAEVEAALRAQAEAQADAEGQRQVAARAAQARQAEALAQATAQPVADEPSRGFFSRFRKRRRPEVAPVAAQASSVEARPTPAPSTPPSQAAQATAQTAAASASASAAPAAAPARPLAARPAMPEHRPPVRLSALAFAPAHRAGDPPDAAASMAEFDKPGAETITASRHPRSRIPAKPALDEDQTLAVLAGVLDDLGAAHHRPFSRD